MLKQDSEPVGIAYEDQAGQVADFHALRHSRSLPTWSPVGTPQNQHCQDEVKSGGIDNTLSNWTAKR